MKKKIVFLLLLIFTIYILCVPKDAVAAAGAGLVLWYERVLPALLPFAILSNLFIYSNYLHVLTRWIAPVLKRLFFVSESGAFVLFSGFLFGFPMGSKNCAELLHCGQMAKEEADVLFIITNNISPVFISSFIFYEQLKMPSLILPALLILYLPPLILGAFLLRKNKTRSGGQEMIQKKPASGSQMNFKIIDAGIMNGFETLARLGGYIMLFSMIVSILNKLPIPDAAILVLTGITEITNGISQLSGSPADPAFKFLLAVGFTAFGGLSGIAQTSSMVKGTGLSMRKYCLVKSALTAITLCFAWIFVQTCF